MMLNPYLNFKGNAEEAFNFYRSVFGGEFKALQRFGDLPDGGKQPPENKDKIMHISLPIGKSTLMATDTFDSIEPPLVIGNNVYLSVDADSKPEADRIFSALSAGGRVEMPMADMFWGDYFGSLADRFGVQWMIVCANKKVE